MDGAPVQRSLNFATYTHTVFLDWPNSARTEAYERVSGGSAATPLPRRRCSIAPLTVTEQPIFACDEMKILEGRSLPRLWSKISDKNADARGVCDSKLSCLTVHSARPTAKKMLSIPLHLPNAKGKRQRTEHFLLHCLQKRNGTLQSRVIGTEQDLLCI